MQSGESIRTIIKVKFFKLILRKKIAGSKAAKNSHGLKATAKTINIVPIKNIPFLLIFEKLFDNNMSPHPRI
jgi:hypothetical protein